jgi:ATP-binding cassette, subfamily B, bacterial
VITITHRPSLILLEADRILIFEKGRIIESGNHYELLQKGGYYKKLWNDVEMFANSLISPVMTPTSTF